MLDWSLLSAAKLSAWYVVVSPTAVLMEMGEGRFAVGSRSSVRRHSFSFGQKLVNDSAGPRLFLSVEASVPCQCFDY